MYAPLIGISIFRRGVVMCEDHNTSEWIFIIKSGTCRVLKALAAVHPNVPGVANLGYAPAPDEAARGTFVFIVKLN